MQHPSNHANCSAFEAQIQRIATPKHPLKVQSSLKKPWRHSPSARQPFILADSSNHIGRNYNSPMNK